MVSLEEWKEQTLPSVGEPWPWVEAGQRFEVFVTFFPREMPTDTKMLVDTLRAKGKAAVQNLQAWKLREELRRWAASDSAVAPRPESAPAPIAGTARGVDFPWRAHARTVNFTDEKPGVIIYRHDIP
jgi:hypothetical protein